MCKTIPDEGKVTRSAFNVQHFDNYLWNEDNWRESIRQEETMKKGILPIVSVSLPLDLSVDVGLCNFIVASCEAKGIVLQLPAWLYSSLSSVIRKKDDGNIGIRQSINISLRTRTGWPCVDMSLGFLCGLGLDSGSVKKWGGRLATRGEGTWTFLGVAVLNRNSLSF